MKYCSNCGTQLADDAVFCTGCGSALQAAPVSPYANPAPVAKESGLATAAKILMIISTVVMGLYLIPLAWCIPMTVSYCKKLKNNEPISTGFKVCTLLFVNTISGILMLCDKDN
ncbi:MAG: zinc-ribbon domain-containing protein [Oscillospiraceae bacterium]|nr:zinc-ribbon domain-containing protein [Oscillospiraceae bacterium]